MKHPYPTTNGIRLFVAAFALAVSAFTARAQAPVHHSDYITANDGDEYVNITPAAHIDDVIVEFPGISDKEVDRVKSVFNGIAGVTVQAYCGNFKMFMLKVDRQLCASDETLMATLKTNECGSFYFKMDATNDQVIAACSDVR